MISPPAAWQEADRLAWQPLLDGRESRYPAFPAGETSSKAGQPGLAKAAEHHHQPRQRGRGLAAGTPCHPAGPQGRGKGGSGVPAGKILVGEGRRVASGVPEGRRRHPAGSPRRRPRAWLFPQGSRVSSQVRTLSTCFLFNVIGTSAVRRPEAGALSWVKAKSRELTHSREGSDPSSAAKGSWTEVGKLMTNSDPMISFPLATR